MDAGAELHHMPCDDFSNDNAGVEQSSLTQALDEFDVIIEQDNGRTLVQSMGLDQERLSGARERLLEESRRLSEESRRLSEESCRLLVESFRLSEENRRLSEESCRSSEENRRLSEESCRSSEESCRSSEESRRLSEENRRLSEESGRLSKERRRLSKELFGENLAYMQEIMAQERDRVAMEGNHLKGRRRGLPLLLEAHGGQQEIMTCYDTGTHANHMSLAKAIELGYTIEPSPDTEPGFQLPNGKIIKAVGQIVVAVQFARQVSSEAASITCRFNVFERLALPVLIGMTFLQATETITKYTSRMVDLPTTWKRSLRLCAVGNATNQVACIIDGRRGFAAADTGSEIALVSGEYAMKYDLLREYGCEVLELADGSLEYTSGFADLAVHVSKSEAHPQSPEFKKVRFHVLSNLQFDVILDEETIDDLSIFQDGVAKILAATSSIVPSLSPIIHLQSIEDSLIQASDTLGGKSKALRTSLKSTFGSLLNPSPITGTPGKTKSHLSSYYRSSLTHLEATVGPTGQSNTGPQNRVKEIPALISQLDQAENRRLDQRERRGASGADAVQKQRYELERTKLLDELRALSVVQGP